MLLKIQIKRKINSDDIPMKDKSKTTSPKEKILIIVRGGVVQNVYASNENVEIDLLDFDNETFSSDELADQEFERRKGYLACVL